MKNDELWNDFLQCISSKLASISFNTWFNGSTLESIRDNNLVINVGTKYKKDYINNYYEDLIDEVISSISSTPYTWELITDDDIVKEEVVEEKVILEEIPDMPRYKNNNSNLDSKYTFDNFMVGESNRLAQTVALSVAEQPGKLYNPLFIYGKSGLGKTHLMQAIGNYVKDNTTKTVLYISCETFIHDFIEINKKNGNNFELIQHFKDKYRTVDVLIIDDIQMLSSATKSQDEFFNTFNFLHGLNKQIIISSDKSPDDLQMLEERLRTRFSWGLTVNITPPDYDLKLKILKNKVSGTEVSLLIKPEVLEYIANNCESDVRHLEGAINRLFAYTAMCSPSEINLEFATEALRDYLGKSIYITNNVAKIQKAVAEYYDITVENLKSKKRTANINYARQVAMYICKMTTDETIERIGLEFNRDHATVIHACTKIEEEYKNSEEVRNIIKEIKDKIAN